jgi:hypothetical protein
MKVKEYAGIASWPPSPGGAFSGTELFPTDQAVVITQVFPVINEFVTFTCHFHGRDHTYDLQMQDQATAEAFALWLGRHVEKTIEQFGEFRLDL